MNSSTSYLNISWSTLEERMKTCPQTKNQSVWEHGQSVKKYLFDLLESLRDNKTEIEGWFIPEWLITFKDQILSSLVSDKSLELYTVYHDCGKPFCRTVDAEGKQHFPDHANISSQVWFEVAKGESLCQEVGELIAHDMDIHLISADEVEKFCTNKNAVSSLLTGLAEVHSNASLFGGIDSVSFKIKWKQINKRGKAICELLFNKKDK